MTDFSGTAPLGTLTKGRVSSIRSVPGNISRPPYVGETGPEKYDGGDVYGQTDLQRIRAASTVAANALKLVGNAIRPGVTTDELDALGHNYLIEHGAYPSTLHYQGFPKSLCTSVNEVICHGIPDDTVLKDGDIINVDITAYLDGMHGDTNATFTVGEVDEESQNLIERTREAMFRGIRVAKPGRQINVIGRAIEVFARRHNLTVVRDFTGHGVGAAFHSGLVVPHYDAAPGYATEMVPGMVITIEPMLALGTGRWNQWDDGWTVVTADRKRTAQFEHTLVITEDGAEVLTLPSENSTS